MTQHKRILVPEKIGEPSEVDYSSPVPDFGPLARDRIPIRTMNENDLGALVAIDRRIVDRDRTRYFEGKLDEVLHDSDIRVSLVAELDGAVVGFIMARVDFGEFGRLEPAAVLDTIGVDPDYRLHGVGRALMSQLLANLTSLRVDRILTEVDWAECELIAFLANCGFRPSSRLSFRYRLPVA